MKRNKLQNLSKIKIVLLILRYNPNIGDRLLGH